MRARTLLSPLWVPALLSLGSAYSPKGNNTKEWINERSWENPLMGRGILTGPEVGKLSSKELGRPGGGGSLEPQGLICTIPTIT